MVVPSYMIQQGTEVTGMTLRHTCLVLNPNSATNKPYALYQVMGALCASLFSHL